MDLTKSHWSEASISSLGDVFTGATPPTNDRTLYGNSYPFVSPADLGEHKYVDYAIKNLSVKGFEGSRKIPKDSVLFVCIGSTIGKTAISRRELTANQQINFIIPKPEIDYEYLYYALSYIAPEIQKQAGEQAVPMINKSSFEKFVLPIPNTLKEQKAIAQALSDIDGLISSLKLELNKKVLLLDALRCELIPNNFLNSNLPVGWEVKRLGDVGNITGAGVDKVIRTDDKFVQLVNYMDVYRNLFIDEKIAFMNTTATQTQIQNCDLIEGDVLFTPTSETPQDIAQSAVIKGNLKNCLYSYHLVRFRPKITFNVEYLAHCFNLTDFKRQTLRAAEGSGTRYVITLPRFRNLEFPFPDSSEQERIGRYLSEAAEEISNSKMLLTKYQSIKQGMMNELLTGKVRLV